MPIHFTENFAKRSCFAGLQNPTRIRIECFGKRAQYEMATDPRFRQKILYSDEALVILKTSLRPR